MSCTNLKTAIMPNYREGGYQTFVGCASLSSINIPLASAVNNYMFQNCYNLSIANVESATRVDRSAFTHCVNLSNISLPYVSSVTQNAFNNAQICKLTFPMSVRIDSYICSGFGPYAIDFLSSVTFSQSALAADINLFNVFLRSTSVVSIPDQNVFSATPIASGIGKIYVPNDLVSSYRTAEHWSTYESQIFSIDDYTDESPGLIETITDSWDEIFSAETDGTYLTKYNLGDTKWAPIRGGWELMQIVAFHADELADGTGYAKITWLGKGCHITLPMNVDGDTTGGWAESDVRAYLNNTVFNDLGSALRAAIKTVKKTYKVYGVEETLTVNDNIWIPSIKEMINPTATWSESSGCNYTAFFTNRESRVKYAGWTTTGNHTWLLRTAYYNDARFYYGIAAAGDYTNIYADNMYGIVFGFCT